MYRGKLAGVNHFGVFIVLPAEVLSAPVAKGDELPLHREPASWAHIEAAFPVGGWKDHDLGNLHWLAVAGQVDQELPECRLKTGGSAVSSL